MEEQIKAVIDWAKAQPVEGCITGSCLLGYFEGQDVDIFTYGEKSFIALIYAMKYDERFVIQDKLEQWKLDKFLSKDKDDTVKYGILTIKFLYNTCIPVNIILKKNCHNIFSVISSFDMDIICKGYDIKTGKTLDLSENLPDNKTTWNRWNQSYYSGEIWEIGRLLRQTVRCVKYWKRGYDTDLIVKKYLSKLDELIAYENLFNSKDFDEKLKVVKFNAQIVKDIFETWLETHEMTDEELELINAKLKEL